MRNRPYCSPLTNDTLFDGSLVCRQYREGYRFSVDAVLAGRFSSPRPGDRVLDLGCGCGVIGLIIAHLHRDENVRVTGLELQPDLAMLAHDNVLANGMEEQIEIIEGDLKRIGDYLAPESFELVVSNPPYGVPGTGRISPTGQRARARHEIDATLEDVVDAAAFAVVNRGRVVFVYPASRAMTLVHLLMSRRLVPKRLLPVYAYPGGGPASLVLLEAVKNGGEGVGLLEPLYIHAEKNGPYTQEMERFYR
ncbi:MAG: methyltransferase [Desulfobulbaceae bacterium]